jgi:hypothetical protein
MSYELDDIRRRLEAVADSFGEDDWGWHWDETYMHLTIEDGDGKPVVTLHVERAQ